MLRWVLSAIFLLFALAAGATSVEAANLTVAWDPATGATGYVVLYGTQSGAYADQLDAGNATQYTISGLAAGVTYFVAVRSYNSAGMSSNSAEVTGTPPATTPTITPGTNDLSGDGYPDLLWQQQQTGRLIAWFMNGTTEVSNNTYSPAGPNDPLRKVVGAGDFDGDGQQDLLLRHSATGDVSVWFMQGTTRRSVGTLSPSGTLGPGWMVVAVADFNRDGSPDILWRSLSSGQLMLWYMQGVTQISTDVLSITVPDLNWSVVGSADFNGDGQLDLVWQHDRLGLLAIWYMQGRTVLSTPLLSPSTVSDTTWKVVGVADVDSDGRPDLIWHNIASGLLTSWLMNGHTMTGVRMFTPANVDPIWRVAVAR